MNPTVNAAPTLETLVAHMARSNDLAARSQQLAAEADANDAELDRLIAQSAYTVDEVCEAMLATSGVEDRV